MGAKAFTKKIGDNTYGYTMLTLEPASDLLALLGNEVGGVVGEIAKGWSGGLQKIDEDALAGAVAHMLKNLSGARIREVIALLCQNATVGQGKLVRPLDDGTRELHFAEFFHELPGFIDFALRAQFGRFFSSLGALASGLKGARKPAAQEDQPPTSPTTSPSDLVS